MYKFFLCLRYLRSRVIAYFAILAVALCVMMMLIVISVMNGFLHKIETAAKGLFGDIVVESGGQLGMTYYDEFIAEVKKLPDVEDASPFILNSIGILTSKDLRISQQVQIAGVRLANPKFNLSTNKVDSATQAGTYGAVSDIGKGLFFQQDGQPPSFDADIQHIRNRLLVTQYQIRRAALEVVQPYAKDDPQWAGFYDKFDDRWKDQAKVPVNDRDKPPILPAPIEVYRKWHDKLTPQQERLLDNLAHAQRLQNTTMETLEKARDSQESMRKLQAQIDQARAKPNNDAQVDQLVEQLNQLADKVSFQPVGRRTIIGVGILSFRTPSGQIIRRVPPGSQIALTLVPLGKEIVSDFDILPDTSRFTVVGDSRTDVSSIDSGFVSIPFETLQALNKMGAGRTDTGETLPARCNQIQIKVKRPSMSEAELQAIRQKIADLWIAFRSQPPHVGYADDSDVQTWRQRQFPLISQIANQRTLVVIMFGIISLVSVVLIFVIFYMIVFQKTKDIGVIKSLGASSTGVAGIFLGYGATVGLVGAVLGTGAGALFVHYINPIHDWVGRVFGLVVWNREWFMFDQIPNEWEWPIAGVIVAAAIAAGLIGALLPAIVAARKQPVEALRYE